MVSIEIDEVYEPEPAPGLGWGWYLAAGIGWFIAGLAILSASPTSIVVISWVVAAVVMVAGALEIANAVLSPSWRWLHGLVGVVFLIAGAMGFLQPFQTFVGLAILFGWYLLLKGMVIFIASIAMRGPGSLWGVGLGIGILYVLIGLWAIGYPDRSAWLLVLWIGIGVLLHGMWDIVRAFEYRSARR